MTLTAPYNLNHPMSNYSDIHTYIWTIFSSLCDYTRLYNKMISMNIRPQTPCVSLLFQTERIFKSSSFISKAKGVWYRQGRINRDPTTLILRIPYWACTRTKAENRYFFVFWLQYNFHNLPECLSHDLNKVGIDFYEYKTNTYLVIPIVLLGSNL